MGKRVKSNLKKILDERNLSIRQVSNMSNNELKFETLRRLYNDETRQFQRDTIGTLCELLNIGISDLFTLINTEDNTNPKDSEN